MTKQLLHAELGWVFRLGDGAEDALDRAYQAQEAAIERISEAMRKLPSFTSTLREGPDTYTTENYEVCAADADDLNDETVFPVWFASRAEFSQQARAELEALAVRAFDEAAAAQGLSCRLLAREECRKWLVLERVSTPVTAS